MAEKFNTLVFNTKDDLLTVLNWMDNSEAKEDVWVKFMLGEEKFELLIPSYGMTWRLFDFPYKYESNNRRRIRTQKSSIIRFIKEN